MAQADDETRMGIMLGFLIVFIIVIGTYFFLQSQKVLKPLTVPRALESPANPARVD